MSRIPLYVQSSHDWHCNKNQNPKPFAVDLNAGTNEYIFGRVTPNNKFIVSTGLVKTPSKYGIEMVGGKKSKSKKQSKGGNVSSEAIYNEVNYKNNKPIYNALDKINKLNGLNSFLENSIINAQNNIVGGKKTLKKKPVTKKPATKKPVTKKPVTKKPVTKKPATKKPVTKKPVTKKPVTKK